MVFWVHKELMQGGLNSAMPLVRSFLSQSVCIKVEHQDADIFFPARAGDPTYASGTSTSQVRWRHERERYEGDLKHPKGEKRCARTHISLNQDHFNKIYALNQVFLKDKFPAERYVSMLRAFQLDKTEDRVKTSSLQLQVLFHFSTAASK